jgi:hypothetical protein
MLLPLLCHKASFGACALLGATEWACLVPELCWTAALVTVELVPMQCAIGPSVQSCASPC